MVHLRLARKDNREEVPLHFEGLGMASWAHLGGWAAGATAAAAGILTMVQLAGSGADVLGALLASIGAVTLAAAIRCRRFETVVGKRWLKWRCGPFHGDTPVGLISGGVTRPSTGWRKLYAAHEVVVQLATGQAGSILPSDEPAELIRVLGSAQGPLLAHRASSSLR